MKKLFYISILFVIGVFLSSKVQANFDNVGTSAGNFLKIGIGARAQGMGSAYVAQANDVTALYWNPAGISNIKNREIGMSQVDWITDVKLQFVGGVVPVGNLLTIGLGVTYLSMGPIKVTNWEYPEGTGENFDSFDMSAALCIARKLTDRFNLGVNLKYIQEKISQCNASAFAVDVGTQYDTGFMGIKIGMALTNFGTKMKLSGRDLNIRVDPYPTEGSNPNDVHANLETIAWPLPIAMRIGGSIDLVKNQWMRVTGNFDFFDERDYDQMWCSGGEVAFFHERFFLRGGVSPRYEDQIRASFGAGLKYQLNETYGLAIDYAYSDLGRLENANRFSLMFTF